MSEKTPDFTKGSWQYREDATSRPDCRFHRVICVDAPGEYPVVSISVRGETRFHDAEGKYKGNTTMSMWDLVPTGQPLPESNESLGGDVIAPGAVTVAAEVGHPLPAEGSPESTQQPTDITPSRYRWTYEGVTFDFYRLCEILGITSHPHAHALKKVIRAGRSVKTLEQDISEAIDALRRWLEMETEGSPSAEPDSVRGDEYPPLPDGFEYLGMGPLKHPMKTDGDLLIFVDGFGAWINAFKGTRSDAYYAARISTEVWERNRPPAPAPDAGLRARYDKAMAAITDAELAEALTQTPPAEGETAEGDFWPCDMSMSRRQLINRIGQMNFQLTARKKHIAALERASHDRERRIEAMEKFLSKVSEGLKLAPLESGVCCCGGAMDKHGISDGHSPVDSGSHYVNKLVEEIDAAIASLKTAAAGEVGK